MTDESKNVLSLIAIIALFLVIGIILGIRIGLAEGENLVFEKYDKLCNEYRKDYMDMKDSYFILKERLLKRANAKGVEL